MLLTICSFNVLASCYKRISNESSKARESDNIELSNKRLSSIFHFYHSLNADIYCIQEYWFNQHVITSYINNIGDDYDIYTMQRTKGRKDGLCILIKKKNNIKVIEKIELNLLEIPSNRICLLLRCQFNTHNNNKEEFLLANIHLTFPHDEKDYQLRLLQLQLILKKIDLYIQHSTCDDNISVLLAGDFNLNTHVRQDNVSLYLLNLGYQHYYNDIQVNTGITHLTHNNTQHLVDFIWQKNTSHAWCINQCYIYPKELDVNKWPNTNQYKLSDHRPVICQYTIPPI